MMIRRAALAFAPLVLALLGPLATASAQWRLCNESSYMVRAAIGYEDSGQVITQGWTRVRPGGCSTLRQQSLRPGRHYLYARTSQAHQGGVKEWSKDVELCVDDFGDTFELSNGVQCEAVGYTTRLFTPITVESASWRTRLLEPHAPTPAQQRITADNARIAGLQRLLADAGHYEHERIDGITGRRTDRAISAFLSTIGRTRAPSDEELMDLLENAALAKAQERGLWVCNYASENVETGEDVWTAYAARRESGWESRGWWRLAPTECVQIADDPDPETEYYLFAELASGDSVRPLAAEGESFCLMRTTFAIEGRNDCESRGYDEGDFVAIATEGPSAVIELSQEDFSSRRRPG